MRIKTALLAAAALVAATSPASAHRQWMLPSGTIFSGENPWVTVDAAVSNDLFYADHVAMPLGNVKAWRPDGTEAKIQNSTTGKLRSVFEVQLDQPGTWRIGTAQSAAQGSFKVDGAEWRVGGRRGPAGPQANRVDSVDQIPANATDIALTENHSRNEIFVTSGEPTEIKASNTGLEMIPLTHPAELVQNEPARFRFIIDGKPAAGLKVDLVAGGKRYRDAEGAFEVVTDADGIATVNWTMPGMFWLNASASDNKPSVARATQRRMSYTTTLEVMAP